MHLETYQPDLEPYFKLYCIECVTDLENHTHSDTWLFLEKLAQHYNIHNVYKACEDMESLEAGLSQLIYEDSEDSDFLIIYFIVKGQANEIVLGDSIYRLEEIAELFEGKLKGRILHFANTKSLDLTEESFQYFLDVTGATAVSGYIHESPIFSAALDLHYFSLYREIYEVVDLVHTLYEKYAKLYHAMGFRLYY